MSYVSNNKGAVICAPGHDDRWKLTRYLQGEDDVYVTDTTVTYDSPSMRFLLMSDGSDHATHTDAMLAFLNADERSE